MTQQFKWEEFELRYLEEKKNINLGKREFSNNTN